MSRGIRTALAACALPAALHATTLVAIPHAEARQPPTAERFAALQAAAQREGWGAQTGVLRAAAEHAYTHGSLDAAAAWFHLGRWAWTFNETEIQFGQRWAEALKAAKSATAATSELTALKPRPIGQALQPEFQTWLIGHAEFSEEFFALLSPVDHVPNVLRILGELHFRDPARFTNYARLALALAVVGDMPPPPVWPHRQVSVAALPRKLPPASEAFTWWTRQDELGRTAHPLAHLRAAELKFVIDAAAPFTELEWAQQIVDFPLSDFARAYSVVRPRPDRAASETAVWPGPTYRLPDLLAEGGICVDQAYFAATAGKARGVPTLLFHGAGRDSRHAWFGFLDGQQTWRLDAGRHAEQRFVTGYTLDPQTWRALSDHELQFLSDRFRERPAFRQARIHTDFAASFLVTGDAVRAAAAARRAVTLEARHPPAWDTLVAATRANGGTALGAETVLREAMRAFENYADLEAMYAAQLTTSLRARGETAAAEAEERRLGGKNRRGRIDLNVQQARVALVRAIATQRLPEQLHVYDAAVDRVGRRAGLVFFDQIVVPFVGHLIDLQQWEDAERAIDRARRVMAIEPGSQLERDFGRLQQNVRATKRVAKP